MVTVTIQLTTAEHASSAKIVFLPSKVSHDQARKTLSCTYLEHNLKMRVYAHTGWQGRSNAPPSAKMLLPAVPHNDCQTYQDGTVWILACGPKIFSPWHLPGEDRPLPANNAEVLTSNTKTRQQTPFLSFERFLPKIRIIWSSKNLFGRVLFFFLFLVFGSCLWSSVRILPKKFLELPFLPKFL